MDEFTQIETSKALIVREGSLVVRQTALDLAIQHSDFDPDSRIKEEDLDSEHDKVEKEFLHVDDLASRLQTKLEDFGVEMNSHPTVAGHFERKIRLSSALAEARGELLDLERELRNAAFSADDVPDGDEDEREERSNLEDDEEDEGDYDEEDVVGFDDPRSKLGKAFRDAKEKAEIQRGTRNRRRLCKALWNKIAGRTHPDRTKDELMHALFRDARKLYDELDLDGLAEIWDAISGDKNSRTDRKRAKLEKLRQALKRRLAQLSELTASDAFTLFRIAQQSGAGIAAMQYASAMNKDNRAMEYELAHVRYQIKMVGWRKRRRDDPHSDEPQPSPPRSALYTHFL